MDKDFEDKLFNFLDKEGLYLHPFDISSIIRADINTGKWVVDGFELDKEKTYVRLNAAIKKAKKE